MNWSADFIGLPFLDGGRDRGGLDCWGLVALVYREKLEIALNPLSGRYASASESQEIAAIVAGESACGPWRPVETGDERDFDVLLFRAYSLPSHVGLVCGRGLMLHATRGRESGLEPYTNGKWLPRLLSAWRHESQCT